MGYTNFYLFVIVFSVYKLYSSSRRIKKFSKINSNVNINIEEDADLEFWISNKYGRGALIVGLFIYEFVSIMFYVYSLYIVKNFYFNILTLSLVAYEVFVFILGARCIFRHTRKELYNVLKKPFVILTWGHSIILLVVIAKKIF